MASENISDELPRKCLFLNSDDLITGRLRDAKDFVVKISF